jgi:hypothetical protein
MKLLFSAFLLSLPSASLAFTPGPTFTAAQIRTQALHMGGVHQREIGGRV